MLTIAAAVGVIIGFIYGTPKVATPIATAMMLIIVAGTVSIFRYGAGPNGIMRTLGQFMGASGATFGYGPSAPFFLKTPRLILSCAQFLHVRWQCHSIRLITNYPTSLRELEKKTYHHGQQTTSFCSSTERTIIREKGPDLTQNQLRHTPFLSMRGSASYI